jgi:succinate dehydrogenase / fumarate reductase cytochrome b subunit
MAITGLLLCGFLVAHLAGNLLLYAPDNGHSYNEYAHALHKQVALLRIAEVGLFVLFVAHIVIAVSITRENRAARKVGYLMRQSKQEGRIAMEGARPDLFMALSGAVILGFLILHLMDFRLELRDAKFYHDANGSDLEPYDKAMALLSSSNLITIAGYALGSFALLAHLAHGFQSAFQTLGLNHPKYTPHIKTVGLIFAFVIGAGFASFPIGGFFKGAATAPSVKKVSSIPLMDSVPRVPNLREGVGKEPLDPKDGAGVSAVRSGDPPDVPTPPPGTIEGVDDPGTKPIRTLLENSPLKNDGPLPSPVPRR